MGAAQAGETPEGEGRIPFTFRIGVTGHRDFADPQAVRAAVRDAIGQIKEFLPISAEQGLVLTAVSALAEGADRLVAEEVLTEKGAQLEAALPMAPGDYLNDFRPESSKQEFTRLLDRAAQVWQVPGLTSRDRGYKLAGHYVVDHCDAVVAVWDGKPPRGDGGTANIIDYARHQKVALIMVRVDGGPSIQWERKPPAVVADVARKMARYNSRPVASPRFDRELNGLRKRLLPDTATAAGPDPLDMSLRPMAQWVFPYTVRAEILAVRRQKIFKPLSTTVFGLAAAAVVVVAVQSNWLHARHWVAWFEFFALLLLLVIQRMNRRLRLYDQWISYRFLAERLRSAYFLTLADASAGPGRRTQHPAAVRARSRTISEAWIERALQEVINRRPRPAAEASPVTVLRDYLSQHWIESQRDYLARASRRQAVLEKRLTLCIELLFAATMLVALFHIAGFGPGESTIVVLSLSIPAIGAAIHGFIAQRQFGPHSERYGRVAEQLELLKEAMEKAHSLDQIRKYAVQAERTLLQENSDWLNVMRFHDIEIIT